MGKVIVSYTSDRRPISRVDKEVKSLETKASNNAINKQTNEGTEQLYKELNHL